MLAWFRTLICRARRAALAVGAAALSGCGSSDWVILGEDDDGAAWGVQESSVARAGALVRSKVSYAPRERGTTPSGKPYDRMVQWRLDDCAAQTFSIQGVAYERRNGALVEDNRIDFGPRTTYAVPPATAAEHVAAHVCALAATRPDPGAGFALGQVKADDWRVLGVEQSARVTVSVLPRTANRDGDLARIVTRTEYAVPGRLPAEITYRTVIDHLEFDCRDDVYIVLSTDYYDAGGELVFSERYADGDPPILWAGDGVAASVPRLACAGRRA